MLALLLFVKLSWNQLTATLCFVSAAGLTDKSLETGLTAGPAMYVIYCLKKLQPIFRALQDKNEDLQEIH